jgi:gluconate 2-dehydrogenase alpha chain
MEYDIGISGQAGNLDGVVQQGGNPFEGPRSRPYPLPPLVKSIGAEMFTGASESLGYHPFPQPAAILSQAYTDLSGRQRSGCLYCGYCTRFGCEVDAKASPNVSHIPMALATGRYEIRTNCKAIKVNMGGDGLATGITYIDQTTQQEHFQPAEIVILSAYTLSNVRLLLLSRDAPHQDGIGNDRGMVGKNYTYQLGGGGATGIFEGRRFNSYMGNSCVQAAIHDFNADNFDHADLDFIGGASLTCGGGENDPVGSAIRLPVAPSQSTGGLQTEEEAKPDAHFPGLPQESGSLTGQGRQWGREWKENLRRNWDSVLGIGIQGESLPYPDQFLDLDPTYKDAHGLPLLRVTFDWHENDYRLFRFVAQRCKKIMETMDPTHLLFKGELEPHNVHSYQSTHSTGGAIMGIDPGSSVTNKFGQVWDAPNVFVTGAALYPQNPGMNPTGHLLAHTYYLADALKARYFRDPGDLLV